ncbi:MAG: SpoIIE family protein phosphatase [Planctomycetes bacterium]|nr:SpoIIE family protein phosphatase [Planctomycetota bacterium]
MRISIRIKLLLATCLPLVVVYLGVLALNYNADKKQAISQAQEQLTEIAAGQASELDIIFEGIQNRADEQRDNLTDLDWSLSAAKEAIEVFRQTPKGGAAPRPSPAAMEILKVLLAQAANMRQNPSLYGMCLAFESRDAGQGFAPYIHKKILPGKRPWPLTQPASGPSPSPPAGPEGRPGDAKEPPARPGIRPPLRTNPKPDRTPENPLQAAKEKLVDMLSISDLAHQKDDFRKLDWYQAAIASPQGAWGTPFFTPNMPDMLVRFSIPFGKDDKIAGVMMVEINLEMLLNRLTNKKIEDGQIMIVGRDGAFIHHPDPAREIRENLPDMAKQHGREDWGEAIRQMGQGQQGVRRVSDIDTGRPSWAVYSPIKTPGWSLLAVIKESRIMDPVNEQLRQFASVMLCGLGVILLLVMYTSLRITRPIGRLASVVSELAAGRLDVQVAGPISRDEIGMFAQTFNKMVRDLKAHIERLRNETAARQAVETEMNVAREIQRSLLPRSFPPFPDRREFDLYAGIVSAKRVAGDFYDFFFIDHDTLAFVIADVSGKGVPAALYMAVTRTVIRNYARAHASPAEVLKQANEILAEDNPRSMFVTLFFGHYNTRTGRIAYCNAGHNPPYIVEAGKKVKPMKEIGGMVLGAHGGNEYKQSETVLNPGDMLALYTDGVTEARAPDDEMFGTDRLEALLAKAAGNPVSDICKFLVQTVHTFRQKEPQDDVTVFLLKRNT